VTAIYQSLAEIVGADHISSRAEERYFYARDPGLQPVSEPDYVVAPKTVDEVQGIVRLASAAKIPVVPMGAGLALTGLVIPLRGGIVVDMKRMNAIVEINEKSRYVVVEGGTSQGALKAYLDKNYPRLRHSIPDAPPTATVVGNVVIHGQGRLSQQYGFNSDMVTGLEVVLASGDICRIGSCATSPYWFSKGAPLPDLSGLFLGWLGTTGIITKCGLKLYPKKAMRDVEIFLTDRAELVPDILYELTHTEMVEDINIWFQPKPLLFRGNHHITLYITGDTTEELEFKRKMVWDSLKKFIDTKDGGFMWLLPAIKPGFLDMPAKNITRFADVCKGGGFEYSGPIVPVEKYAVFAKKLEELAQKYEVAYSGTARVIGNSHALMFAFAFTFNRADAAMMERVRAALDEAGEFSLHEGGVPWKPTVDEQQNILREMESNTVALLKKIKKMMDPDGIMNPGNWEVR